MNMTSDALRTRMIEESNRLIYDQFNNRIITMAWMRACGADSRSAVGSHVHAEIAELRLL